MTIVSQVPVYGESGSGRFKYGSLAETHPHLADEWSPLNSKSFGEVTPGSAYKALWLCGDHTRTLEVYRKLRGVKCRECTTPLTETHPELAAEWSPANDVPASQITQGMARFAVWICSTNPEHQWEARVHSRSAGRGCPECSHIAKTWATPGVDDLMTTHPEFAIEWSPDNDRDVVTVSYGSNYRAKWICSTDSTHTWEAGVNARTNNNTWCPKCGNRKTSRVENELQEAVSGVLTVSADQGTDLRWGNGVPITVDILAVEPKIAIEYDGSYWHKDTADRDLTKTMALLDAGYTVVRVREQSRQFSLPLLPLEHPNLHQILHTLTRTDSQDFSAVTKLIVSLS